MTKFTEDQLEVLESGANGISIRYEHKWATRFGKPVTRAVNRLETMGLVSITSYRNGPGLSYTEAGRKIRQELGFA